MENCYDIMIENEDFTLGKVLENIAYQNFFNESKTMSYVSSYKDHPHESYIKLRIAYNDNVEKQVILNDMKKVVSDCVIVYDNIKNVMRN